MPIRRPRTTVEDVATVLGRQLRAELTAAAGGNDLLSRAEQAQAMPHVQQAADEIRAAGGPGARVSVDALEQNLTAKARRLIDAVNQPSGSGASLLSRSEANAAFVQGGRLGEAVLRAWEVASGNGIDVDEVARARATLNIPTDAVWKTFATEAEATSFVEPNGLHVYWLVPGKDELLKKSFTVGRNDLWVERIDIDRLTGAVTVTAEH